MILERLNRVIFEYGQACCDISEPYRRLTAASALSAQDTILKRASMIVLKDTFC